MASVAGSNVVAFKSSGISGGSRVSTDVNIGNLRQWCPLRGGGGSSRAQLRFPIGLQCSRSKSSRASSGNSNLLLPFVSLLLFV